MGAVGSAGVTGGKKIGVWLPPSSSCTEKAGKKAGRLWLTQGCFLPQAARSGGPDSGGPAAVDTQGLTCPLWPRRCAPVNMAPGLPVPGPCGSHQ